MPDELVLPLGYRLATEKECLELHAMVSRTPVYQVRQHWLPLQWDSTFRFACLRCGSCCQTRSPSWENMIKVEADRLGDYCMARGLAEPVFNRNRDRWQIPGEPLGVCAWLRRGPAERAICAVHEVKPAVCRLAPVGGMIDHTERVVALALIRARMDPIDGCMGMSGGHARRHRVDDWCREHGLTQWLIEAHEDMERKVPIEEQEHA